MDDNEDVSYAGNGHQLFTMLLLLDSYRAFGRTIGISAGITDAPGGRDRYRKRVIFMRVYKSTYLLQTCLFVGLAWRTASIVWLAREVGGLIMKKEKKVEIKLTGGKQRQLSSTFSALA